MMKTEDHTVILTGHIDVPDDRLDAVKSALPEHIALTRAEAGCVAFDVVQSDTVRGRFMVSEVFVDQIAFNTHQERTGNSSWSKTTEGIPRDYSVTGGEH
jgi:quinol monooxygenase YgiN